MELGASEQPSKEPLRAPSRGVGEGGSGGSQDPPNFRSGYAVGLSLLGKGAHISAIEAEICFKEAEI